MKNALSRLSKNIILFLIRIYRLAVSPFLPPACRYVPSCSQYAQEAVERFGVRKGIRMGFKRVCRCHPWGSFGYDPVDTKD